MTNVARALVWMMFFASAAAAQQSPANRAPAKTPAPAKEEPKPACEKFAVAQNAVYASYIRQVVADLPDPAKASDRAQLGRDLEALHGKWMETAKGGDIIALRKAIALEIFAMQLKKEPPIEMTQKKLCLMAKQPGREAIMDTLACAVTSLDGPRREQPGNKELARQMMEKAKSAIPENANASDTSKLLFDDVTRGLAGCY